MARTKKTGREKLLDQIRILSDNVGKDVFIKLKESDTASDLDDNEYGPHTVLKLSYLNYYLGLFTRIANRYKSNHLFDKVVFIDAFGGSGVVNVRGTKYTVLGSSMLAALNPLFDKVITFEIDNKRAHKLQKRLDVVAPGKCLVKKGDVNLLLKPIVDKEITDRTIVLFFVDPEGMEPDFSELKYLMERTKYVDIIMNFTWGVYRLDGRIQAKFNESDIKRMKMLIPSYEPGMDPTDAALGMFEDMFGKPYGDKVEIRSSGHRTEYSLILRIRKTQSGTAWLDPMVDFGRIIGMCDGDVALDLLRQAMGDAVSLF